MNDTLTTLDGQLDFALYACSKELIRAYKPLLAPLNLTYTQYLVMSVLWHTSQTNSRDMGRLLYLDSGTLTPVLKALEQKGYLRRSRSQVDSRQLIITITSDGYALKDKAARLASQASALTHLSPEDEQQLTALLGKLLTGLTQ